MKKMLMAAFIATVIAVQVGVIHPAYADEGRATGPSIVATAPDGQKQQPMIKKGRPHISREQAVQLLNEKYGFSQDELGIYFDNGKSFRELDQFCLYAYLSQRPLSEVVRLKDEYTRERLKLALGLTPEKFYERSLIYQSSALAKELKRPKNTVLKYLKNGYTAGDIKMAYALADKNNSSVNNIMKMRTIISSWPDIASKIGVDSEEYLKTAENIGFIDTGGKRTGAGFAGLRVTEPTKEKLVGILHNDYGFSEDELGRYYDEVGFNDLEIFCMYAYFAKKPLENVISMRDKYTWEGLKLALGLTPQKFRDGAIAYQADRLLKRMDIKRAVTIKYMRLGFPMHHVNTAALLAIKCGKDIETVLLMKKPNNTWNDVALRLGLTLQDSQEIKERITKSFKR